MGDILVLFLLLRILKTLNVLYLTLTASPNSVQLHFKCSVSTCGSCLLCWTIPSLNSRVMHASATSAFQGSLLKGEPQSNPYSESEFTF